jgi:competence protein ComEA
MIQIPTADEAEAVQAKEQEISDGLVNINTASLEELKTLPGIGDARARSIIAYRESQGEFASIQDIKNIDGIGDGMFSKLESCIKVK